ncbi:MAG: N-acetyl sugar amidotransferase [Deltaproteobacteria bacterium]|nr:N-acetyl sugar amidotransferase [Deltaproteobacteria bacterium]
MDTSDPEIQFDHPSGRCSYCKLYDHRVRHDLFHGEERERKLAAIVAKVKAEGSGHEYDCLIGLSGGVDRTTAVWELKKRGLRPLAIHLDNGWNAELAVDNIKKVLDKLQIDLYTYVIDWEEFKDIQLSFLRASVPNSEIPTDHAIVCLHLKVALERNIRYMFIGANLATEAFMPVAWGYDPRDLKHLRAIHRRFGNVPLTTFPQLSVRTSLYAVLWRRIRWLSVLNYVSYDKQSAIEMLRQHFGYRPYGAKHFESVYTRFFQGYILPVKFGFNKKRAHLSSLVLSGGISRAQALEDMAKEDYVGTALCAEDREFVIKKLGLTEAEFEEIMRLPPRSHYHYPNNRLLFERMPWLFGRFKRLVTTV